MSAQNDGGLAFPYEEHNSDGTLHRDHYGVSARDYFAGKAIQGCAVHLYEEYSRADVAGDITRSLAAKAYAIADAMLAERTKGEQS